MVAMPLLFVFMAYAFTSVFDFFRTRNAGVGVALYLLIVPLVLVQNFNLLIGFNQIMSLVPEQRGFNRSNYNKQQNTTVV
jgi:hypothetical protein